MRPGPLERHSRSLERGVSEETIEIFDRRKRSTAPSVVAFEFPSNFFMDHFRRIASRIEAAAYVLNQKVNCIFIRIPCDQK